MKALIFLLKLFRTLRQLIGYIPFGKFALVLTSKLCVLLFDGLFFLIGTLVTALKFKSGELSQYWEENAVIEDIKLGVSGQHTLNFLLRSKDNPPHLKIGHRLHTISDMLGRFKPTKQGLWWRDKLLEKIDTSHCQKSVKNGNRALLKRVDELGI